MRIFCQGKVKRRRSIVLEWFLGCHDLLATGVNEADQEDLLATGRWEVRDKKHVLNDTDHDGEAVTCCIIVL